MDHLTPPLTRAEGHGLYQELEALLDEYAMAEASDPRRAKALAKDILGFAHETGLAEDIGLKGETSDDLVTLDTALCDLKELQIRDGLHVFGALPARDQLADLTVAIARLPRGSRPEDASLLRALADDLILAFDPLTREFGQPWTLAKPDMLATLGDGPWRTVGDTVERLEALALRLVTGEAEPPGPVSAAVLDWVKADLQERLKASAEQETQNLLQGLAGRFVPPARLAGPGRMCCPRGATSTRLMCVPCRPPPRGGSARHPPKPC